MASNEQRPDIESIRTGAEFERWYWLRSELVDFCRDHGLGTSGRKPELANRIAHFLNTGQIQRSTPASPTSTVDWRKAELTLETEITDSYSNTQNMRSFMRLNAADHFKFSNEFMDWMRSNQGKTLADAVAFWLDLDDRKRNGGYREKPLPQNQFNQFTRALSEAVPGISAKEVRRLWAIKRAKPGPHVYEPGDEAL